MNSFIQSKTASANHCGPGNSRLGDLKFRTAALAIGTIGAIVMSLVLASAASPPGDHRTGGAIVQKSPGRCKVPTAPAAFAT